jgi:hypothetical protein
MMRTALNIDFRSNAEKKKVSSLRGSSRTSQLIAKGPIRGREME